MSNSIADAVACIAVDHPDEAAELQILANAASNLPDLSEKDLLKILVMGMVFEVTNTTPGP